MRIFNPSLPHISICTRPQATRLGTYVVYSSTNTRYIFSSSPLPCSPTQTHVLLLPGHPAQYSLFPSILTRSLRVITRFLLFFGMGNRLPQIPKPSGPSPDQYRTWIWRSKKRPKRVALLEPPYLSTSVPGCSQGYP